MTSPEWTRTIFVRELKRRFLSAFLDKRSTMTMEITSGADAARTPRRACPTNREAFWSRFISVTTATGCCNTIDCHQDSGSTLILSASLRTSKRMPNDSCHASVPGRNMEAPGGAPMAICRFFKRVKQLRPTLRVRNGRYGNGTRRRLNAKSKPFM
jgi:hypothetical protein